MKLPLSFAVLALTFSVSTSATENFEAQKFHQESCTGCHDTSVYTRKKRRVGNLDQLESQVRMCDANLGKKLFDDDIQSLTGYLNTHYYHFDQK